MQKLASQATLSEKVLVLYNPLLFLANDYFNAVILCKIQVIPDVIQMDFGPYDCIQAL